jgi:hypothetical protein
MSKIARTQCLALKWCIAEFWSCKEITDLKRITYVNGRNERTSSALSRLLFAGSLSRTWVYPELQLFLILVNRL